MLQTLINDSCPLKIVSTTKVKDRCRSSRVNSCQRCSACQRQESSTLRQRLLSTTRANNSCQRLVSSDSCQRQDATTRVKESTTRAGSATLVSDKRQEPTTLVNGSRQRQGSTTLVNGLLADKSQRLLSATAINDIQESTLLVNDNVDACQPDDCC